MQEASLLSNTHVFNATKWREVDTSDEYEKVEHEKIAGEPDYKIYPKIPQGVIPSVDLKEAYKQHIVVDPSVISDNFDNERVHNDLKS